MSQLQRIQQTRDALIDALAERNWEAIGELDTACRDCVERAGRKAGGRSRAAREP